MILLYIYLAVAATLPWAFVRHLFTDDKLWFRITLATIASLSWGWVAYMIVRNLFIETVIKIQRGSG